MRFKLDECVDVRLARLFEDAGYDAETVFSEKLSGATDKILYDLCLKEKRTLVTQDLDFSRPKTDKTGVSQVLCVLRSHRGVNSLALDRHDIYLNPPGRTKGTKKNLDRITSCLHLTTILARHGIRTTSRPWG